MSYFPKVAIVRIVKGYQEALHRAFSLIGGINDLNVDNLDVALKVGVYDIRALNYPNLEVMKALVTAFNQAPRIFLVESDNYVDDALKRLQLWKDIFTTRILPFNLSKDRETKEVTIAGEKINLSHILFKPNVFISFHAYRASRGLGRAPHGAILKNLLGVIPDIEKERFHNKLDVALIDIMEVVGGIDLAVLDATYSYYGKFQTGKPLDRIKTDLLIVGRDAVAVDAVGSAIVGRDPLDSPSIVEAAKRGLGQSDLKKIEVLGEPLKSVKVRLPKP